MQLHPCGGSGQGWYSQTQLPSYADTNGFVLIYPSTSHYSSCWDVNNPATLTHNQGGDALGIVSMVNYTVSKYSADTTKIFVMGASSGAMMTNVMAGSYPDVFAAGAAFSGTAHACFAGSTGDPTPFGANQTCAQGLEHTPEEWAAFVHNTYPGYTGRRPRMMIVHGLADTLVRPQCATEALKQWSNILNVTKSNTVQGSPSSAYYTDMYGDGTQLQGIWGNGVGHFAPVNEPLILKFFGITS